MTYRPINVKEHFGATGDGVADDTAAIQNAIDTGLDVFLPVGDYLITSTLTMGTSHRYIFGSGSGSRILANITDGTPAIDFPESLARVGARNLAIYSDDNTIKNFTALRMLATRWNMDDVEVRYSAIGIDWDGGTAGSFIGSGHNVWIRNCTLGFTFKFMNNIDLALHLENCAQPFIIESGNGSRIDLMCEGTTFPTSSSTIDNVNGITFSSLYVEYTAGTASVPFVVIGGTTECNAIEITATRLVYQDYDGPVIDLDDVDGFRFHGTINLNIGKELVRTTANTQNLDIVASSTNATNGHLHYPAHYSLGAATNLYDDPFMSRGIPNITSDVNCTSVVDTTEVLPWATQSLKQTVTSAGSAQSIWAIDFSAHPQFKRLLGKTAGFGTWVKAPDNVSYVLNATRCDLRVTPNGTGAAASALANRNWAPGEWVFRWTENAIPSDATKITFDAFPNRSTDDVSGEIVYWGGFLVWDGGKANWHKFANGNWVNYIPETSEEFFSSRVETAANTDATPSVAGVRILKTSNAGPTTITNFDDAAPNQSLTVVIQDSNTTLAHSSALNLSKGSNYAASSGDVLEFYNDGTDWYEKLTTV